MPTTRSRKGGEMTLQEYMKDETNANTDVAITAPATATTALRPQNQQMQKQKLKKQKAQLPALVAFPVLVLLNLAVSGLLYASVKQYSGLGEDLRRVSRREGGWERLVGIMGWRVAELATAWFAGFGPWDMVALSVLSKSPALYLLDSSYATSRSTVLLKLAIDTLATYLPFRVLVPLQQRPAYTAEFEEEVLPVAQDKVIKSVTSLIPAVIYSLTVYVAATTFLPMYLALYFEGVESLEALHRATPFGLVPMSVVLGYAFREFVFEKALLAGQELTLNTRKITLHGEQNIWGSSEKTAIIIKRTLAVMLISGINTFVETFAVIDGVEATGAIAYSAVWVVAAALSGMALGGVATAE